MEDDPLDVSALAPDPARFERMVAAVVARSKPGLPQLLAAWARPVWAVAGGLSLAAALLFVSATPSSTTRLPRQLDEALIGWMTEEREPSVLELRYAIGGEHGNTTP